MVSNDGLRFTWVGAHMESAPALEALLRSGVRLDAVITLDPATRARRSGTADYGLILGGYDVPLHEVSDINGEESAALLESLAPDVVFVLGWSQIIRPRVLAIPRMGMVGAHASLLPHNRGSAPVNWALINGEQVTGNSLIWLAETVDDGDLIDQVEFSISPYDTCANLYERVAESNRDMVLRLVKALGEGRRPGQPTAEAGETLLPRRRPSDGLIEWGVDSRRVYDFIRALTRPYPGAFSWIDGARSTIWESALLPEVGVLGSPGQVLGPIVSPNPAACGQLVACGKGAICLLEVEGGEGVLRGRELSEQAWTGRTWTGG